MINTSWSSECAGTASEIGCRNADSAAERTETQTPDERAGSGTESQRKIGHRSSRRQKKSHRRVTEELTRAQKFLSQKKKKRKHTCDPGGVAAGRIRMQVQSFTAPKIDGNQVQNCSIRLPEPKPPLDPGDRARSHLNHPKTIDTKRKTTRKCVQIRHPESGGPNSDPGLDPISMRFRCQKTAKTRHPETREPKWDPERNGFQWGLASKKGSKNRPPNRRPKIGPNTP